MNLWTQQAEVKTSIEYRILYTSNCVIARLPIAYEPDGQNHRRNYKDTRWRRVIRAWTLLESAWPTDGAHARCRQHAIIDDSPARKRSEAMDDEILATTLALTYRLAKIESSQRIAIEKNGCSALSKLECSRPRLARTCAVDRWPSTHLVTGAEAISLPVASTSAGQRRVHVYVAGISARTSTSPATSAHPRGSACRRASSASSDVGGGARMEHEPRTKSRHWLRSN